MHTFQISESLLENFKNDKLSDVRINFLIAQANEQLEEMAQNKELYDSFLKKVNAPEKIDKIILWILLMSNETIGSKYIREFKKDFRKFIPVSDLADLLLHVVYLKKVKNIELDGLDYLLEYEEEGIEVMDQYAFTNVLLYIQRSKEAPMEF
ncbi:MAG TPA: hypothetical protein PLM93_03530 [Sulfuricurvum sp.]|nr:MAG: hypothetical protein B7Y30_06450 [Campylobacterales bacterium 16-40-21]OZA04236.1 MAG: hypothetical protein B7X89_01380 [Sulfuricurvum sp. 17-40-25]HQS66247.1 hypothetical protein [Sulfuricurvum sp.]HQT36856.1 hypothetical protein [Sulfuricurvum sp.]